MQNAELLHNRLLTSWTAARDATLESQSDAVADTTRTQDTHVAISPGDMVCRGLTLRGLRVNPTV